MEKDIHEEQFKNQGIDLQNGKDTLKMGIYEIHVKRATPK